MTPAKTKNNNNPIKAFTMLLSRFINSVTLDQFFTNFLQSRWYPQILKNKLIENQVNTIATNGIGCTPNIKLIINSRVTGKIDCIAKRYQNFRKIYFLKFKGRIFI